MNAERLAAAHLRFPAVVVRAACALAALALLGCGGSSDDDQPVACFNDAAPGTVTTLATNIGPSEGIAFLDGDLYVAGGEGVRRIGADGSATLVAAIPGTIGMAAWNGALYVASQSDGSPFAFCAPTNQGVIWKVTASGEQTVFARGFISPNFVVVTPWNTLLVSDDCQTNTNLYEVDASGNTSTWSNGVTSANGLGFDVDYGSVFAVNTFVRSPGLYRIPVTGSAAGAVTKLVNLPMGSTPDGLAVDAQGNVYVTLNILGVIHKIAPDGTASLFAQGMTTPASLAFGDGPGFDPCSMYVTSLTGMDVYRVVVGAMGVVLEPQ